MIYWIISILIVAVVILTASLGAYYNHKRYISFVSENSLCLRALKQINSEFTFFPFVSFDYSHTYDNEKYYETISCEDFLIYQLQFQAANIMAQIKKVNQNKTEYAKYIDRISSLQFGNFSGPDTAFKRKKLLEIEKKVFQKERKQAPPTQFSLKVTLKCINGRIIDSKRDTFSAETIIALIKRLNNKTGTFYRDRGIWDALCRVERGKVTNTLRFSIYKRDGYRCRICGISELHAKLEIDHIIPISKGGKSEYDNLQTLCHRCNTEKGNKI